MEKEPSVQQSSSGDDKNDPFCGPLFRFEVSSFNLSCRHSDCMKPVGSSRSKIGEHLRKFHPEIKAKVEQEHGSISRFARLVRATMEKSKVASNRKDCNGIVLPSQQFGKACENGVEVVRMECLSCHRSFAHRHSFKNHCNNTNNGRCLLAECAPRLFLESKAGM